MRELASRSTDGVHVQLLWSAHENRVTVVVDDERRGEAFMVDVVEHEHALDVFNHPFAYADAN